MTINLFTIRVDSFAEDWYVSLLNIDHIDYMDADLLTIGWMSGRFYLDLLFFRFLRYHAWRSL